MKQLIQIRRNKITHTKENYTKVINWVIREGNLSLAALGLLTFLLSNRSDFTYSKSQLYEKFGSRRRVDNAFNELIEKGYGAMAEEVRSSDGKFMLRGCIVSETPNNKSVKELTDVHNVQRNGIVYKTDMTSCTKRTTDHVQNVQDHKTIQNTIQKTKEKKESTLSDGSEYKENATLSEEGETFLLKQPKKEKKSEAEKRNKGRPDSPEEIQAHYEAKGYAPALAKSLSQYVWNWYEGENWMVSQGQGKPKKEMVNWKGAATKALNWKGMKEIISQFDSIKPVERFVPW